MKTLRGAGEVGAVKNRHCSWQKDVSSIPSIHGTQLTASLEPQLQSIPCCLLVHRKTK